AFNTQPLRSRAAIVAAGPVANLLLAAVLYAVVNWSGVEEPKPILASPVAGSLAQQAGIASGDWVASSAVGEAEPMEMGSFGDLRWRLTQAALSGDDMTLWVGKGEGAPTRAVLLPLSQLDVREVDAKLFERMGITHLVTSQKPCFGGGTSFNDPTHHRRAPRCVPWTVFLSPTGSNCDP